MEGAVACPLQLNAARNVGPVVARFFFFLFLPFLKRSHKLGLCVAYMRVCEYIKSPYLETTKVNEKMPLQDKRNSFAGPQLLSSAMQGGKLFCDEFI